MHWWKWVGVAAFAGVAATGVVVARAERRQRHYTPEEIRARLHARAAEAVEDDDGDPATPGGPWAPTPAASAGAAGNGSNGGDLRGSG